MSALAPHRAREVVAGFFDAYRARDVEAMVSACSDGADFVYVPFEVWGKQRVLHGHGKVRGVGKVLWTGLLASFLDLTNEVTSIEPDEDGNVAAEVTLQGTQSHVWGTIDNPGARFAVRHLFLFHLDEAGLIDRIHAYWDGADLCRQLGRVEID